MDSLPDSPPAVSYACDMLGCSIELLEGCLTKRSVETRKDFVLKPLSKDEVSQLVGVPRSPRVASYPAFPR